MELTKANIETIRRREHLVTGSEVGELALDRTRPAFRFGTGSTSAARTDVPPHGRHLLGPIEVEELLDRFVTSQKFSQTDPWAERAQGKAREDLPADSPQRHHNDDHQQIF